MLKMIITDAVVSKGFEDKPAIRFFDGDNGFQSASFRIGKRVYDSKAEGNNRWINLSVKAFGDLCERIKKMKLKEGSYINLIARYDEESWEDKGTRERRTAPVLILDEIEYCSSGGSGQKKGTDGRGSEDRTAPAGSSRSGRAYSGTPQEQPYPPAPQGPSYPPAPQPYPPAPSMPENFTGYENYGGQQGQFF